jgi:DNA-binding protein HU-beta
LNKSDLIDGLEARLGDRKVAIAALDGFLDIVNRAVAKGEKVSISGFGTFEKVNRPARKARNPRTGEQVRVKKTAVPKFRPGTSFKSVAAGTTKLGREPKHDPLLPAGVTKIVNNALKDEVATPAKKTTAKKAPAKATGTKSTAAATSGAKASPARKTTTAKKAPAKTTAAKKTATRKNAATKVTAKAS